MFFNRTLYNDLYLRKLIKYGQKYKAHMAKIQLVDELIAMKIPLPKMWL